jgi:hypothetical protein
VPIQLAGNVRSPGRVSLFHFERDEHVPSTFDGTDPFTAQERCPAILRGIATIAIIVTPAMRGM